MTKKEWDTIQYFNVRENWGNSEKMDFHLIKMIDSLRCALRKKIIIHEGFSLEGHAPNSFHKTGQAVDLHIEGLKVDDILIFMLRAWWFGGIGIYPYWNNPGFHLDLGPSRVWMQEEKGGKYIKISSWTDIQRGLGFSG